MAARIFASNETQGYFNQEVYVFFEPASGSITADTTPGVKFCPVNGTITNVILAVGTNGVDNTNPLDLKATASVNGTAICTTDPDIAKAAGTGAKNTVSAGTGLTLAVVKSDGTQTVTQGQVLKCLFDITRTASPGTEIADVCAIIVIRPSAV